KLASPEYVAVIESLPTGNAEVVSEAVNTVPFWTRGAVPSVVVPNLNVTVPVGAPAAALTVAVSVTDCPKTLGLAELASDVEVVVDELLTTWTTADDVLPVTLPSPA